MAELLNTYFLVEIEQACTATVQKALNRTPRFSGDIRRLQAASRELDAAATSYTQDPPKECGMKNTQARGHTPGQIIHAAWL